MQISGDDLTTFLEDYRWLCGVLMEEELFFRRENRYRLSTFAEAERTVYADRVFMTRYMNGLLMTQLWWANHSSVLRYYRDSFLPGNKQQCRHLEIGPGHGLFLYLAASAPNAGAIAGWDVSPASIAITRSAMNAMGATRPFDLSLVNMFEAPGGQFDSLTFSEVLEHLENPAQALAAIANLLAPSGRAFIQAPVNSPAPDHISLFRSPEEIVELVRESGLVVEDTLFAPPAGVTLERAREMALTISTVVVASKSG
ncbi:MAG: class I SAM-dependent methyltransferase [Methylocystaceae bacterium]|nr:MAG: class I SAM-dependent methyltransferase [Methylocystaceae bacterium]